MWVYFLYVVKPKMEIRAYVYVEKRKDEKREIRVSIP